jgi:undecaprenyl-diphosphatase
MDLIQIVVLSIVQGITEFLPISSSAHLILISKLFGWQDQGILFDIYLHGGSLFAIIYAFRKEVSKLIQRAFSPYKQNLLLCLIVATLPVAIVGFLGGDFIEQNFRSLEFLILTTFLFAIFLFISDRYGKKTNSIKSIDLKDSFIVGMFQIFALMPGVSRSAITMIGALILSYSREDAARFSFLLSIPTLSAVLLGSSIEAIQSEETIDWSILILGGLISFVVSLLCINLFISFIQKIGFTPFVLYRIILSITLVGILWI